MRPRVSLGLQLCLWFVLNLAVLAAVGAALAWAQLGWGWQTLLRGSAGERLDSLTQTAMARLDDAEPRTRGSVLQEVGKPYGLTLSLYRNNGVRLEGPVLEMPSAVTRALSQRPWERVGANARRRDPTPGRFLVRAGTPVRYWIGVRVPWQPDDSDGPGAPATLLAVADSLGAVARLFDWAPWLLGAAVVTTLSALFWLPVARGITRSVATVSAAADRIADGRMDTRLELRRNDEIGDLGRAINRMAERLDGLVTGQKRFLAEAAHELCSPLARLQLAVGIMEEQTPAALQGAVEDVREEVAAMAALAHALLDFTRAGMAEPKREVLELREICLAALAAETRSGGDAAEPRVTVTVRENVRVVADAILLGRALSNLIRNALRHAAGTPVLISGGLEKTGTILVAVEDQGPGVQETELERLGEPFHRPDFARTRDAGGTGLGLAIVRSTVAACGGTVRFANRPGGGLRVEVRLAGQVS